MSDSLAKPLKPPGCHREVIDLWPSLAIFAGEIGIPYDSAKQMRRRNSIGDQYRLAVVERAGERGFAGITFELLVMTAPKRLSQATRIERGVDA